MNKFYEILHKIGDFINLSTSWLWTLLVIILIKEPLKKLFNKIGYWLSEGFNADVVAKILKPFQNKIDKMDRRINKVEIKLETFEEKQDKILVDIEHSKNNIKFIKEMLESIGEDEKEIIKKLNRNYEKS
jgi:uncharacterized protein YaaN involved in tellurite resistance